MGLDWLAGNRPKPGHEDEFRNLLERADKTDEAVARFQEISIPAYSQVGAPVVGTDRLADAWVLAHARRAEDDDSPLEMPDLEDPASYSPRDDAEKATLAEMTGYYVLELAPRCDGLPIYTHGGMMDELDLTSFRGKFLHDCEQIIGEELLDKAYEDLAPAQLVAFGNTLIDHARRHAAEHACPGVEHELMPPDDLESAGSRAHILFAAGRWCVYWGERGHYLETWF